jgi:hypothetical protein
MKNIICLKLFVLVLFISFFSSPAQAAYKKKVLVGQFQNPANWDKPYDPGIIISELLTQELMHQKNVQLISISKNMQKLMNSSNSSPDGNYVEPTIFDSRKSSFPEVVFIQNTGPEMMKSPNKMVPSMMPMDDDPLWPAKLGKKVHKSTFTEIRGKIIKFLPNNRMGGSAVSTLSENRENAEIEVHLELVQHSTGRVLHEKTFRKISRLGTHPFSIGKISFTDMNGNDGLSSMNSALNSLKHSIGAFISEKIDYLPLEGEIISTKRKEIAGKRGEKTLVEEAILVNIGSSNGVRIGDLFQVDAVGLGLSDPYTAGDLGDVYVKIGVIQILQTWEGTAKAMSLAGKNFETGYLVRSVTSIGRRGLSPMNNKSTRQEEEKVPWWEFHGIRSVN